MTAIALASLAALLFVAIALPTHAYTLIPDQIHTLPAAIRLNYSAPVTIVGAELWNVLSGQREAVFTAGNFTDISGNGTVYRIAIANVLPGTHDLVVSKNDSAPPFKILKDDPVRFEYQPSDAAFNIHLTIPQPLAPTLPGHPYEEGFTQSAPYRANFTTTKPGWCRYSLNGLSDPSYMMPFEETGDQTNQTTEHAITGLVAATIDPLIVWCNSTENGAITTAFVLGYEDTPPSFTVTADPAIIVDELNSQTLVTVRSDQPVYCELTGNGTHQSLAPDGLGPGDAGAYSYTPATNLTFTARPDEPVEKNFQVDCVDRAGRTATKTFTVRINFEYTPAISMVSPDRYTRDRNVVLAVQVVKHGTPVKSGSCAFANGTQLATADGITYNATFANLADGTYSYRMTCVIADGVTVRGNVAFDVDTTPPPAARTITAPPTVCGDQPFTAQVNLSPDTEEDPGFAGYRFNITYTSGNKVVASGNSPPDEELVADFEATENTSYVWHVWPYDLSGNVGTELTATSVALADDDSRCDVTPPLVDIHTDDTLLGTSVTLNWTDTEPGARRPTATTSSRRTRPRRTAPTRPSGNTSSRSSSARTAASAIVRPTGTETTPPALSWWASTAPSSRRPATARTPSSTRVSTRPVLTVEANATRVLSVRTARPVGTASPESATPASASPRPAPMRSRTRTNRTWTVVVRATPVPWVRPATATRTARAVTARPGTARRSRPAVAQQRTTAPPARSATPAPALSLCRPTAPRNAARTRTASTASANPPPARGRRRSSPSS